MKSKKAIQECIKKLKLLRTGIPPRSMFGDNNWGCIDKQVEVLKQSLNKSEDDLKSDLEKTLDGWGGNFPEENTPDKWKVDALDWVLGNTDEDLVSDEDIKLFCKGKGKKK